MTASYEALSALDALFLSLESSRTPMHAGSIAIFEDAPFTDEHGAIEIDAVRRQIESRLDMVPKLRQRVRFPRFDQSGPIWVDDAEFAITRHVRHLALSAPGTEAHLVDLSADLLAVPLDRGHPLWELWFIDGLADGRVALVEKIHHALADGLASVELATVLLDVEPHPPSGQRPPSSWRPHAGPREATLLAHDLLRTWSRPVTSGRSALLSLRHPVRSTRRLTELVEAMGTLATARTLAPRSSINVPVSQGRRVALVRQSMDQVKAVERRYAVTVNDVFLAAVTGGLRAQLQARGDLDEATSLQALVPVGMDAHGDHRLGNKVSAMFVRLPVGVDDPVARLETVARGVRACKEHRQVLVGQYLTHWLDSWPHIALTGAAQLVHHQPFVNVVVTNVPGPTVPLYLMGARMLEAFPIVPLGGNLSLGVAAFSYDGQLSVGIFADRERCADVEIMAEGMRSSFADLVTAAKGRPLEAAKPGDGAAPRLGARPQRADSRHARHHRAVIRPAGQREPKGGCTRDEGARVPAPVSAPG